MKLTTHLYLVPRLSKNGEANTSNPNFTLPPLTYTSSTFCVLTCVSYVSHKVNNYFPKQQGWSLLWSVSCEVRAEFLYKLDEYQSVNGAP
jgi:hypothetical protein